MKQSSFDTAVFWVCWNGVCVIKGKYVVPNHPSCAYGRKLMNNERSAEAMRRKHGYKKRPPKPIPQENMEDE